MSGPAPIGRSLYLVLLPLDGALQLVQLVLQLRDDVRLSLYLVQLRLPLALQQGALHLRLEEWTEHRVTQCHRLSCETFGASPE